MEKARRRSAAQQRGGARREYYIEGNAVRHMEAMPDYRREHEERIRREQELEHKRRRRAIRRNQQKALRTSKSYVAFLTMAVLVFGTFAGIYIQLQSGMTARLRTISSLESQLEDVRADNDEAYKRISTARNLDSVRNAAMTELGMSYAKESQIVYYSVGDDDYMNQYGEIPQK